MSYEPPGGWIEDLAEEETTPRACRSMPRPVDPDWEAQRLMGVDKPYSATRRCAAPDAEA